MPEDPGSVGQNFDTDQASASEIAAEYGLSQPTIRVWITRGLINAHKEGRAWMVSRAEVAQMLADNPTLGKPRTSRGTGHSPDSTPALVSRRGPGHYSLVEELGLE
jgi:excisionase family DNA binding protein